MGVMIRDVRTICCAPEGINLVIAKIEITEPGLYGIGRATSARRHPAVVTAVEEYLKPFLIGKDISYTEDTQQAAMGMSYWRDGPVLNNALSDVGMALWDVRGKMADMPLYRLFGEKCREAVPCYTHAEGNPVKDAVEKAAYLKENGCRYVRAQAGRCSGNEMIHQPPEGTLSGVYYDPKVYMKETIKLFGKLRDTFGDELELCHGVHEHLTPVDAVGFARQIEQFQLFFLEDILSPEQVSWFERIRSQTATPLAMGGLFNSPNKWVDLIRNRRADYIRVHLSQIGGITPARKLIALCNAFGVRAAWHGLVDLTPVGHAVNTHLDIPSPNFGIQEWSDNICGSSADRNPGALEEIFSGIPKAKRRYIYLNDKPDISVDINEEAAGKFPCSSEVVTWSWMPPKLPDGTSVRP